MKSESTHPDPLSAGERWIDAALTEHARLGRDGADEELILRILRQTVDRPARTTTGGGLGLAFNWKNASISMAAIAAAIAMILGVLSLFPVESGKRRSDELRFIVRVSAPGAPDAKPPKTSPAPLAVDRHAVAWEVITPPAVAGGDVSISQMVRGVDPAFAPSFDRLPRKGDHIEDLRITADHGMTSSDGLVYEGDVLVEHAQFRIEADSVRLPKAGSPALSLLAKRVRVVQSSPACVAEAESLSFDPASGSLVLTGVTRMETKSGALDRFAPGDKLVLSGEGFTVENAPIVKSASMPLRVP